MKKVILFCTLLLIALTLNSQWFKHSTVTGKPYEFAMVDSDTGFLKTVLGGIYSTTDGWKTSTGSCQPHFRTWDLKIVDSLLVGLGNRVSDNKPGIFVSQNSCNWSVDLVSATGGMQTVNYYKEHIYYNVASGVLIKHNIHNGQEDSSLFGHYVAISKLSTNLGWQFATGRTMTQNGNFNHIYRYNDSKWVEVYQSTNGPRAIRSINNFVYGYGPAGVLVQSIDSGLTWQVINTPANKLDITNAWFINSNLGFVCGGNTRNGTEGFIYRTYDGGKTWDNITPPTSALINDIYFINDSVGICADNEGNIYKTWNRGGAAIKDTTQNPGDTSNTALINEYGDFSKPHIELFPNPTENRFTIQISGVKEIAVKLVLTDSRGKAVLEESLITPRKVIDISVLANGVYYLQLQGENWQSVKKVVKE